MEPNRAFQYKTECTAKKRKTGTMITQDSIKEELLFTLSFENNSFRYVPVPRRNKNKRGTPKISRLFITKCSKGPFSL
jgi:hypothetical protein